MEEVKIADIDVGIGQMAILMIKFSIATIPAAIILTILFAICSTILGPILLFFIRSGI